MSAQTIGWLSGIVNTWTEGVIRACWQGSLFILAVWVACRLMPRLSPAARHWLWWLACLKLVVSLAWITPLNVPLLPASAPQARAGSQIEMPVAPIAVGSAVKGRLSATAMPESSQLSLTDLLFVAWLTGMVLCLGRIIKQSLFVLRIARGGRSLDDTDFGGQTRRMGVSLGIARSPRLVSSSQVSSPLVIGFVRPMVILPEGLCDSLQPDEFQAVLAHELAHVRRNDLLLGFIPAVAYSLFFALPPLWLAYREWQAAREAACDAEALMATGVPAARYAQLLLKIIGQDNRPAYPSALGATAGYHTLKSRLQLLKARSTGNGSHLRVATASLALVALLFLAPWRVTTRRYAISPPALASVSHTRIKSTAPPSEGADVADVPSQELKAEGDANKRYLLMGPGASTPPGGYHLLVVLPGGDGGTDFQFFVRRISKFALTGDYLVAEPIAPIWSPDQPDNVVWPTDSSPWPSMKFSTEEFVEAVVRDVGARYKVDSRYVFTLGWASGGPPVYALSLRRRTPVTGSFVAMSVFHPEALPPLKYADSQPYYLLQPTDVAFLPVKDAKRVQTTLTRNGAKVELATYQGGYGWNQDVYEQIRTGVSWLELHRAK